MLVGIFHGPRPCWASRYYNTMHQKVREIHTHLASNILGMSKLQCGRRTRWTFHIRLADTKRQPSKRKQQLQPLNGIEQPSTLLLCLRAESRTRGKDGSLLQRKTRGFDRECDLYVRTGTRMNQSCDAESKYLQIIMIWK